MTRSNVIPFRTRPTVEPRFCANEIDEARRELRRLNTIMRIADREGHPCSFDAVCYAGANVLRVVTRIRKLAATKAKSVRKARDAAEKARRQ